MTTIAVHGFSFDPGSHDNDPAPFFGAIDGLLNTKCVRFPWYSCPLDFRGEERAIGAGFPHQYAYAFRKLAPEAAKGLVTLAMGFKDPPDAIGHSLGSRVIMQAIRLGAKFRRIVLLDGAEIQPEVPDDLGGAEVLNVVVNEDLVLRDLGSNFNDLCIAPCIGQAGVGRALSGWEEVVLDNPATALRAAMKRGWQLRGAMPPTAHLTPLEALRGLGDHWTSYQWTGNGPLYQAWLTCDPLIDVLTNPAPVTTAA